MKFKNNGESVQVRINEKSLFGGEGCRWTLVRKGEVVDLPENIGLANGFEKVTDDAVNDAVNDADKKQMNTDKKTDKITEGKIGTTKVSTKQIEKNEVEYTSDDLFLKELIAINGIGEKTAEDIVTWGTKEKLIEVIELRGKLPFRDDIAKLLEGKYGC